MDVKPALENRPARSRVVLIDDDGDFFFVVQTLPVELGMRVGREGWWLWGCVFSCHFALFAVQTAPPAPPLLPHHGAVPVESGGDCESVPLLPFVNSSFPCQASLSCRGSPPPHNRCPLKVKLVIIVFTSATAGCQMERVAVKRRG